MFIRLEKRTFLAKKFWTATVTGNALAIETGRIGRSGVVNTFTYDSPEQAWQRAQEQASHRIAKGFVEVERQEPTAPEPTAPEPTAPEPPSHDAPAPAETTPDTPSIREQFEAQNNGWNAITRACSTLYDEQEPVHWAPSLSPAFEGGAPLNGVSAYDAGDHWHYVGYGLTDLYDNSDPNWERSNFGYELTFRLAKGDEDKPPAWGASLLHAVAGAQLSRDRIYTSPSAVGMGQPLDRQPGTRLTNVLLLTDSELPEMQTPNGLVEFLQIVGITDREMNAIRQNKQTQLMDALRNESSLLVTNIRRAASHDIPSDIPTLTLPTDVADALVRQLSSMGADDTRKIPAFGVVRTMTSVVVMHRDGDAKDAPEPWSALADALDTADREGKTVTVPGSGLLYAIRPKPVRGKVYPTVWQLQH